MRLRNKKTGEVVELFGISCKGDRTFVKFEDERGVFKGEYNSLAELNEEWEDYKEPKEYWYIDDAGVIQIDQVLASEINMRKSIGNYFKTKEEAEKAVEKLMAWKRLEDGGITFKNWTINQTGTIDCFATWGNNIPPSRKDPTLQEDLDLLFSQEDD